MASDAGVESSRLIQSLDFTPSDAIMDPTQPVIYLTDVSHNRVLAVNYQTGTQTALSFSLKPEHLTFANGELYVTLLKNGHHWYTQAPLSGAIAIINPQTWTVTDQFDIATDPYGIAVDQNGDIYVTPGSNQSGAIMVYSRASKGLVASTKNSSIMPIQAWTHAMLQPGTGKLYTISSFPPDTANPDTYNPDNLNKTLGIYRLVNQEIQQDQNYLAQYDHISAPMRFSPDGQYLFNGSGEVLDPDFQYVTFISPFSDIAFNPVSKGFYIALKGSNTIKEYAFNDTGSDGLERIEPMGNYPSTGQVAYLFYNASQLIAVSKNSSGGYFIELISVTAREPYTPNPYPHVLIPLDFTPTETIIDPKNPVLYMTDQANNKVYALNYQTKEIKSCQLDFPPERITFDNGELYVTLLKGSIQHWADVPGSIQILNAQTLQPVDRLDLSFDPSDVVVKDGKIIVIPGPKSLARITNYSRQTKEAISIGTLWLNGDIAQLNPILPRVYTSDTRSIAGDMQYFSIQNGSLGDPVSWPSSNHGTYNSSQNFRISPDGNYVFDGNGEVFDQELNHVASLGHSFNDFAFSTDSQRIYAATVKDQILNIYDTKTGPASASFFQVGALTTLGQAQNLFTRNNQLVVVSSNKHREVVTTPAWIEFFPLQTVNSGQLTVQNAFPNAELKDISVNTPVMLAFSDQVFTGDPSNIIIRDANGQTVNTKVSLQAINNLLILKFDQDLHYNSSYTVAISGNAGINASGQGFSDQAYSVSFRTGQEFKRLGGQDRYDTAVKISQQGWLKANTAVLATGENFPDALSAAPLAKKFNAPILLTTSNELPGQTESELARLQVRQVFIIGGYGAVSAAIEEKLQAKGISTVRLQGADRYATSVAIANYLGPVSQIFVATGDSFPDALSIASYAAQKQIPILLTQKDSLPAVLNDYLQHNRITKTYIVGGEGVISLNESEHLINPERIAGNNRYETNLAVLEKFGFDYSDTFIATGENFPDALAGSALAGAGGNPVLLVSNYISQMTIDTLHANKGMMKMKYILGGEGVVHSSLLNKIFTG